MDNNTVLDSLVDVGKWVNFLNYNNPNGSNMDMRPNLAKCNVGNCFEGRDAGAGMTGAKIDAFAVRDSSTAVIGGAVNNSLAWLDLKEVLPVLKNINANAGLKSLNTNLFKNLKVVVEFNTNLNEYMKETNDTNTATFEPRLIADEIIGVNEKNNLSGIGAL